VKNWGSQQKNRSGKSRSVGTDDKSYVDTSPHPAYYPILISCNHCVTQSGPFTERVATRMCGISAEMQPQPGQTKWAGPVCAKYRVCRVSFP